MTAAEEARVFGRYVVGREVDAASSALYERALALPDFSQDDGATRFARANPWAIAALDGALALTDPGAPLRRRLLLAAAILETQPAFCDAFLPRDRRSAYGAYLALSLLWSGARTLFGLLLLPLLR